MKEDKSRENKMALAHFSTPNTMGLMLKKILVGWVDLEVRILLEIYRHSSKRV